MKVGDEGSRVGRDGLKDVMEDGKVGRLEDDGIDPRRV